MSGQLQSHSQLLIYRSVRYSNATYTACRLFDTSALQGDDVPSSEVWTHTIQNAWAEHLARPFGRVYRYEGRPCGAQKVQQAENKTSRSFIGTSSHKEDNSGNSGERK